MEKDESRILWAGIAFLLVMALIGWAKYIDQKKDTELWYDAYSDSMDELRDVTTSRDDIEFMRQACIHDRDYYKNALDDVPAYCSKGLCEVKIEGLRARVDFLEGQVDSCTRAYLLGAPCSQRPDGIQCGWDMCRCSLGELGWVGPDREICDDLGITTYYVAQALCVYDSNCSACLEMTDGNVDHCFRYAYYP